MSPSATPEGSDGAGDLGVHSIGKHLFQGLLSSLPQSLQGEDQSSTLMDAVMSAVYQGSKITDTQGC